MTPRDQMLATIRNALGPAGSQNEHQPACPADRARAAATAAQFEESFKVLGGEVFHAANIDEARATIDRIVAGRSYLASPAPIVEACGFSTPFSREAAASAHFGISSADFALADTGSLVFLSESGESRLISLLPPHHIAVLEKEKIVSGLDQLFARVPHPAARSSSMVIVTGPSRTGDIEMRLVRGVHGPGEVTVIIVDDVTRR